MIASCKTKNAEVSIAELSTMNPKRIDINYSSDEEPSLHSMQPIDPYVSDGEGPDPPPGIRPAKKRTTKNFLRAVTGIGGLKIPRASTSVGQVLQLNLAENREELARIARMAVKEKEVSAVTRP